MLLKVMLVIRLKYNYINVYIYIFKKIFIIHERSFVRRNKVLLLKFLTLPTLLLK